MTASPRKTPAARHKARVIATSSDAERSDGGRSFLQRRLALLAAVATAINVLGLTVQISIDPVERITTVPVALISLTTVGLVSVWIICRGTPRSPRYLRALEATTMTLVAIANGLIVHAVPAGAVDAILDPESADHSKVFFVELGAFGAFNYVAAVCVLALTHTFVLRAALVPSTVRRTLALTVIGGVVMMATFAVPIPGWDDDERLREMLPEYAALAVVVGVMVWWAMTTIVCVVVTWVVHGLQREVRDARQLGQYRLEAKLGEGGMGIVYRAQHALLRRPTAVKILPPDKAGEQDIARFEREVRLTATLSHPNTVRVFDYGRTPDGLFYYAMELLDGASVEQIVTAVGPQSPARTAYVVGRVAAALVEAHGHGLIHRDIKPGNIVLCSQGGEHDVPKLLDFGLVKDVEEGGTQLTQANTITGTPAYLAPEVIGSADAAGPRSDLYALGAVGYYLVTGSHVFTGGNVVEVCSHHLHTPPEPPSERLGRRIPEALEDLILECLAKDPHDRPASAAALLDRLESVEGVGTWTVADRNGWWEENEEVVASHGPQVEAFSDTLMIDLAKRTPQRD